MPKQSAALSYDTQHVMPPEFGGKWGMECLTYNTNKAKNLKMENS